MPYAMGTGWNFAARKNNLNKHKNENNYTKLDIYLVAYRCDASRYGDCPVGIAKYAPKGRTRCPGPTDPTQGPGTHARGLFFLRCRYLGGEVNPFGCGPLSSTGGKPKPYFAVCRLAVRTCFPSSLCHPCGGRRIQVVGGGPFGG